MVTGLLQEMHKTSLNHEQWPKTGAPGAFWPKTDVP